MDKKILDQIVGMILALLIVANTATNLNKFVEMKLALLAVAVANTETYPLTWTLTIDTVSS
jgi:hypothetical protein